MVGSRRGFALIAAHIAFGIGNYTGICSLLCQFTGGCSGPPIEDAPNCIKEGLKFEGFWKEGSRSLAKRNLPIARADRPADIDHGNGPSALRQVETLVKFQSSEMRHINVQDNNVGAFVNDNLTGLGCAMARNNVELLAAKANRKRHQDLSVVVYDHDFRQE